MALATYSGLIAKIWDDLDKTQVTGLAEDWITLAESRMNKALRVNAMIARATATISDAYSAVPSDFLAPRSARLVASPYTLLQFVTPEQMADLKAAQITGDVAYYALVGNEFEYGPAPAVSQDVTLSYYAKIPALSDSNTSNWVLADHPEAYLRGALLEAGLYYRDDGLVAANGQLFEAAMDAIRAASRSDLAANLTPQPSTYAI